MLIKESIRKVMLRLYTTKQKLFEWSGTYTTNLLKATIDYGTVQSIESSINLLEEIRFFRTETALTMEWLGWGKWHDCEEKCKWNELCYIPAWPVIYAPGKHQGGIYGGSVLSAGEMRDFWKPKYLSRDDFDCGGGRAREPKHRFPDVQHNESEEAPPH